MTKKDKLVCHIIIYVILTSPLWLTSKLLESLSNLVLFPYSYVYKKLFIKRLKEIVAEENQ